MGDESIFHLMSDLVEKEGVSCVLIGGFAVNCYNVSRQTADVDFLITHDDFNKIIAFLVNAGYEQDLIQENFVQLKSTKASLLDLDFMFVDHETLSKILSDGQKIEIAGQKHFVPSLNHLIALKLHSIKFNSKLRLNKDLPDIVNLIRVNNYNYKDQEFRELCLKYGNEDIHSKIMDALQ